MTEDIKNQDGEIADSDTLEGRLDQLKHYITAANRNLEKIEKLVLKIEQDRRKELYMSMPGEEGVFDGYFMICDDGKKIQVPPNYAAESKLVFGDRLKMIVEGDKKLFKQIERVEREVLEGVATRKEGNWFVLTEKGSYRISNVAAEFNNLELNQEIVVVVPQNDKKADFATLDEVSGKSKSHEAPSKPKVVKKEEEVEVEKKEDKKPVEKEVKKIEIKKPSKVEKKSVEKEPKKETVKEEKSKEFVAGILDDDDDLR